MQAGPAEARALDLRAGDQPIPGFSLVRRRGRGGFGEVWEAEASGGILVALKFVVLSSRARAAELRALDFVRGIHHPNLLANFGSWQVEDTLVIGMELADRSLWDRHVEATRQGLRGIPGRELLVYLAEVAAGVGYLNERRHSVDGRAGVGIQHCDLKPPNILLFGGGAKVADLGLARVMEGDLESHAGIWTYAYAAPEFFRGETARQSDQYSLAVTYCQLRGGRLPFGGNAASVTAGHLFGRPDVDALPEPERPIVERALAKAPGDRWPDCRAFVDALRALPRDSFEDCLIDPDGPADLDGGGPSTGVPLIDLALDSDADREPGRPPGSSTPDLAASFPLSSDPPAILSDQAPTLVLPSRPDPRDPAPRSPRGSRAVATMASSATILLAVLGASAGLHSPPHEHPAAPAARRPAPPNHLLAEGIGAAAAEPPPSDPEPATPLPSAPAEPESIELEPIPTSDEPAAPTRQVPVPDRQDRPTVALEGPIEMNPIQLGELPGLATRPIIQPRAGSSSPDPERKALASPDRVVVRAGSRPAEEAAARGRALLGEGAFARAVAEFDAALRLEPGQVAGHLSRAIARHRSGDLAGALADYSEAIRLRPGLALAHLSRGQAYHDLGSYDRAIDDYDAAIRLRPEDADARLRRGLARYRAGDFEGSIGDFSEALRLDPKNARAAELKADCLARVDSRDARLASFHAAPGVPPAPVPAAGPARPDDDLARAVSSSGPGPGPVRETVLRVTQDPAAPPGERKGAIGSPRNPPPPTRPAPNPAPNDRRRPLLRRIVAWPFQKPK